MQWWKFKELVGRVCTLNERVMVSEEFPSICLYRHDVTAITTVCNSECLIPERKNRVSSKIGCKLYKVLLRNATADYTYK